jgi:glycosyltransferase involved in cell wall biosynthesis
VTHSTLPLVSIVTPSLNQAGYLEATIQSVLSQDYPRLEYIVIDGGSRDGSLEIIRRYADRLAYWSSEPDSGQTEAINKGLERAQGEILAWLNSDDVYFPGAVREAVEFLENHREVGMVYGDAHYIDETGMPVGLFPARQTNLQRLRRGFVHIPQQASFFRGSLWRLVGALDPSFYFAMDYDLWVRIASLSPLQYLPRTWAGFRLHRDAKTLAAAERCWPEMIRVHRRDGGGVLSVLHAKYVVRRVLEPMLPYRLRARLWLHQIGSRWRTRAG